MAEREYHGGRSCGSALLVVSVSGVASSTKGRARALPAAALRFMQEHQLSGRIFNQYVWGGFMEWNAS